MHYSLIISKWLNLCLFESVRPQIWEGVNKARDEKQERALSDQKYLSILSQYYSFSAQLPVARPALCLPAMEPVHKESETDQQVDVVATVYRRLANRSTRRTLLL